MTSTEFPNSDIGKYLRRVYMNCSGNSGGFRSLSITNDRGKKSKDNWGWKWRCMNGTPSSSGSYVAGGEKVAFLSTCAA